LLSLVLATHGSSGKKKFDRFEIVALCNNYILSIDSHNIEQFADNFLDDGGYDNPWGVAKGRKEILEKINYWHQSGITKGKRHYIGAVRVTELNGDTAKVESNYWVAEAATAPGIVATGFLPRHCEKGQRTVENCFQKASCRPKLQKPINNNWVLQDSLPQEIHNFV
jgi:hypothetical protein